MANTSYGLRSLVQTFAPPLVGAPGSSPFIPARVIDIILDNKHENFKNQGEWDSIGTIQFRSIYIPSNERNKNNFSFAKPFFSNIKHYPLKNEIVFILFLPNSDTRNNYDGSYYYIDTINIWSNIHHNALPDVSNPNNYPENQKRDYIETLNGASRKISDNTSEIDLGKTFKEKANIHSLLPYEGDTVVEGRWGQSIRLGSTVVKSNTKNLWSTVGNNGDPIIIIRNRQSVKVPKEGWIPILEDINSDGSSIYVGNKQAIPITVASTNTDSFNISFTPSSAEVTLLADISPTLPSQNSSENDSNIDSNANPNSTPAVQSTKPILGNDADFWSLLAICGFEDSDDQGRADVAQSIYNRAISGKYSSTIAGVIKANNQYEPAFGRSNGEPALGMNTSPVWNAIKDKDTAIAAVILKRQSKGERNITADDAFNFLKKVYDALKNPILQQNAKNFIQGRTDFLSITQGTVDQRNTRVRASFPGRATFVMRDTGTPNNVFGWAYYYDKNVVAEPPDQNWWNSFAQYFNPSA